MSGTRRTGDAASREALLALMAQVKTDRAKDDAFALRGKTCPIQRPGLKR